MSCELTREQLLTCEEPASPPAGLARHLAQCAACRAFRCRLLEVEDGVRSLAVPPSAQRDRLIARLQEGELPTPPLSGTWSAFRPTLKERAHQKAALALALAASLALFALGWGLAPHGTPSVDAKKNAHQELVRTRAPRQTVQELARFVRRLEGDILRAPADQAEPLAVFYIYLVEEDLPARAKVLSPAERAEVLPGVLEQLLRSESEVSRASADRLEEPSDDLRRMARAARAGQARLRALLG